MLQAAATSCRDTQASSKAGSTARVGSAYIIGELAHSLSEVVFNASSAAFACKASSLLTAVLTKISSKNCCSRDLQLTYARSANPKNSSKSTRPFSSLEWVGSGHETTA